MFQPILSAALAAILLSSTTAMAADPAVKCESGKLKVSGKYAGCLLKADAKAVTKNESADYTKCVLKYSDSWSKIEDKAAGTCPSDGDETTIQDFLEACDVSVADALAGGTLLRDPVTCDSELSSTNDELTTCDADLATCGSDLSSTNADLGNCSTDLSSTNSDLGLCTGNLSTCTGDFGTCSTDLSSTNADLGNCSTDLDGCENPTCGDNQSDLGEQCDGTDLNGATCVSLGYGGGTLACASCAFDASGCVIPASCDAAQAGADCGEQLLLNGDAETGARSPWSAIPITSVNTWASSTGTFQQPSGTGSYLFVLGGNYEASAIQQDVAVTASCGGRDATLSAYVGAAQGSLSGGQVGVMTLSFLDAGGAELGSSPVSSGGGSSPVVLSLLSTGPVAIPVGTVTVRARFTRGGRHVIGIDNVTLTITC